MPNLCSITSAPTSSAAIQAMRTSAQSALDNAFMDMWFSSSGRLGFYPYSWAPLDPG